MILSLSPHCFSSLVRWWLTTSLMRSIASDASAEVQGDRLALTLVDLRWQEMLADLGWLPRTAAVAMLPSTLNLHITAKLRDQSSIVVTWELDHGLLGMLQKLPLGINPGRRLAMALLGDLISERDNTQFILNLNRLPEAITVHTRRWQIVNLSVPYHQTALHLEAQPAATNI